MPTDLLIVPSRSVSIAVTVSGKRGEKHTVVIGNVIPIIGNLDSNDGVYLRGDFDHRFVIIDLEREIKTTFFDFVQTFQTKL